MFFEIALFVLGAAFLIVSFFVGNEQQAEPAERSAFVFHRLLHLPRHLGRAGRVCTENGEYGGVHPQGIR